MKLFKTIFAALIVSALFTNCKKVLDKEDLTHSTPGQIFNDSTVAILNINYLYTANQPGWFGDTGGAIGSGGDKCDEFYSDNAYVKGTVTIETVGDIGTSVNISNNYGRIRNINQTLQDLDASTLPASTKNRYKAQAYFWRAFRYFDLVRLYGGVPLVLKPLDAIGQDAKNAALLPRNKTSECFKQIVSDLDSCIKYLPAKWSGSDYGRISSAAAAAFKGRVLLTYASPQFNPSNDAARWQAAADANDKAMQILSANNYGLNPSYDNMWFTENSSNPEAILITGFNTSSTDQNQNNNTYDNATRPAYLGTKGGSNQPTWDIVKSYPMLDGKAPGTSLKYTYDDAKFFDNRDPRFNKTIAYNGCNWPINGNSSYRLWTYFYYNKADGSGVKTTEPASATGSGFYLRKAIDPNVSVANTPYVGTDWMEIRYAEVLLNQAECAAALGNVTTGYTNITAIRKRAGIEAGADNLYGLDAGMSPDQMINAIMNERKIEFAFEGKRYWDLRRRKLLESTLNGTKRTGLTVTLNNNASGKDYLTGTRDALAATSLDALYSTSFTVKTKTMDSYNIAVQSGDYFFGIPSAALLNNINLQQNNTWGGPFDPLQ
ncbi:RagB/SusD family nutrient uptake outer membrane protein [Mucilaginibacter gossypii]|uniref:RagB/SusD family nutrient uptake outer membrane protein n=1 Tax=Mucilaginibacter gossypii TaxID=551996 RepID=UPI000DCEB6AE|nr:MULTISPECIES: RagB/SusD family nutrient uptake outer membrane protein [Mucilaginibacter]QTE37175.1 RagB/SusD family nutrient uptake outer membrane protein [Mucilaginibacter gossypii]RAV59156.1 RagB/SusD family nutrient uptake outer membrane protein [Mucilaginibacter rubeus]